MTKSPTPNRWSSASNERPEVGQVQTTPADHHRQHEDWPSRRHRGPGSGGIAAGARAVQVLTPVVVALGMIPLTRAVHIPLINRAVSAGGPFKSEDRLGSSAMLDDLFDRVAECGSPRQPQG